MWRWWDGAAEGTFLQWLCDTKLTHCLPWNCSPRKGTCLQDSEWWETGIPVSGRERLILKMKLGHFCSLFSSIVGMKWTLAMNALLYEGPGPSAATSMERSRHSAAMLHIMRKALRPSSCVHSPFLAFHKPTHSLSYPSYCFWFLSQVYISNPFPEMRADQWVLSSVWEMSQGMAEQVPVLNQWHIMVGKNQSSFSKTY